jgi:hypothetical protein
MAKYYVNDYGTELIVDTDSDITTATVTKLIVRKPISGKVVEWVGTIYDTTKIKYVITSGDWDEAGIYFLQAYVELPNWKGRGSTAQFIVEDAFE